MTLYRQKKLASITRREVIRGAAILAVAGPTVLLTGCDKKDVEFYVATVTGSLEQLKPLLPNQADMITKAISIAKEMNKAYQDGRFDSAKSLATNLTSTINDIIIAAGVNLSDPVKMIISIANVALGTVAVLIESSAPRSTMNRAAAVSAPSLMSPKQVNAIFEASRL